MRAVPSLPGYTETQSLPRSRVCRSVSNRPHWLHTCSGSGTHRSPAIKVAQTQANSACSAMWHHALYITLGVMTAHHKETSQVAR